MIRRPTVPIGKIVGLFGIRGELKCDATSAGTPLFQRGAQFEYERAAQRGTIRLRAVRTHQTRLLLSIEGIEDAASAEQFVGALLLAPKQEIPLGHSEYLDEDLIGCRVVTATGETCGFVERVEHYPASDMLVVSGGMIPMVSAIVRNVDLTGRIITIDPPAGLLR